MVPLYAARIDLVRVECAVCGHDVLIPPSALLHGLRLAPTTLVVDLEPRLRCRECDARGTAVVSVRWVDLHALGACDKGRHNGRSIDAYATAVGRPKQSVRNEVQAAEVYLETKKTIDDFFATGLSTYPPT
jgi:hypothetical protein